MRNTLYGAMLMVPLLAGTNSCSYIERIDDKLPELVLLETLPPIDNQPELIARANVKYKLVRVGENLQLDASFSSASYDIRSVFWELLKKPPGSQAGILQENNRQSSITFDKQGVYDVRLKVEDDNNNQSHFDMRFSTELDDLPQTAFIAIGDFGTGDEQQYNVAQAIARVCQSARCDFVIGLGDNFYPAGVNAIDDQQFEKKFEQPYSSINVPFYLVLGNHDTTSVSDGDGIYNMRGDIQIAYSKSEDKPSFRFQMPARYYSIPSPVEGPQEQALVEFYALDTTLLTSPKDVIPRYDLHRSLKRQERWLKSKIEKSIAQWKIAYAHHPYVSNGVHGNAGDYDGVAVLGDKELWSRVSGVYVKNFIEDNICDKVDLYFSGHDHNLQYLMPVRECGETEFIVSGAGGKSNNLKEADRNPVYWQAEKVTGFFYVHIVADKMTIKAYTVAKGEDAAVEAFSRAVSY